VPSPSRRRARVTARIDGLKVRVIEDPTPAGADFGRALRLAARMMIRSHEDVGDHEAIIHGSGSSSALTDSPSPRPDHVDDAA
jgi:hypothetical protein